MAAVARMAADFPPSPGLALKENHFRIGISKKETFTFTLKFKMNFSEHHRKGECLAKKPY